MHDSEQFHLIQTLIIVIYWVRRGNFLVLMLLLTDEGAGFRSLEFLQCWPLLLFIETIKPLSRCQTSES